MQIGKSQNGFAFRGLVAYHETKDSSSNKGMAAMEELQRKTMGEYESILNGTRHESHQKMYLAINHGTITEQRSWAQQLKEAGVNAVVVGKTSGRRIQRAYKKFTDRVRIGY